MKTNSSLTVFRVAATALCLAPAVLAAQPARVAKAATMWHDLAILPIEGKGWTGTKHPFDRLPAKAEGVVRPPVWALAQNSAGLRIRFVSDAEVLKARWKLNGSGPLALPHMPASGASGLDLYVRDAGQWRWLANARPEKPDLNERTIVQGLKRQTREYMLYLPLYNGIAAVEIGLPAGASFAPAPAREVSRKPIVFYGTSIVHGGCVSRPGMVYSSILGRKLDWPTINLGFGGNGKTEPEMAALLAELDPAAYVMDSLPNLSAAEVRERVEPFFKTLRAHHPETPILLVENVNYADTSLVEARRVRVADANAILRALFERLKAAGDKNVYYAAASQLLGGDGEDTVDGTHPTDLGSMRMAEGLAPIVREALRGAGASVADDEGFESLFDGKTLAGWKPHDGFPKEHVGGKWWVEDGAINGTQFPPGKGGFLWVDRKFSDFVLRLQVKLEYPIDSGVFLRVGPTGLSHQVTLDYRPASDIGAIYIPFTQKMVQRNQEGIRALRKEEWNDLEIRIEGEPARIRMWMNGRLVTDFQHTAATTKGVPERGGIALQIHPDVGGLTLFKEGNRVRFRNIRIKELEAK